MSHGCESYVVPYCIHSFTNTNDLLLLEVLSCPDHDRESLYDYFPEVEEAEEPIGDYEFYLQTLEAKGISFFSPEENEKKRVLLNGWYSGYWDEDTWSPSEEDQIYGVVWRKGDNVVLVTNTDEGSHVGEYDLTVSARDKDSLVLFAADFNLLNDCKIKSNQAIQHWS